MQPARILLINCLEWNIEEVCVNTQTSEWFDGRIDLDQVTKPSLNLFKIYARTKGIWPILQHFGENKEFGPYYNILRENTSTHLHNQKSVLRQFANNPWFTKIYEKKTREKALRKSPLIPQSLIKTKSVHVSKILRTYSTN